DWPVAEVALAASADGVEAFERKAEGIDPLVANVTARVGAVLLGKLTHSEIFRGFVVGQAGYIFRRFGQLVAEKHFGNPVAAQNWAGARGAGLFGENGCLAEDSPTGEFLHAGHPPPLLAIHIGN